MRAPNGEAWCPKCWERFDKQKELEEGRLEGVDEKDPFVAMLEEQHKQEQSGEQEG
jgi:hypothetical protein